MKIFFLLFLFFLANMYAQELPKIRTVGTISYVSSQYYYVQFDNTEGFSAGDTLFITTEINTVPALRIKFISTRSAACEKISGMTIPMKKGTDLFGYRKQIAQEVQPDDKTAVASTNTDISGKNKLPKVIDDNLKITGRLSLLSASDFASASSFNSQRWRSSINFTVENFIVPRLSLCDYMIYSYSDKDRQSIKSDPFKNLKIYDLALLYKPSPELSLWLGRHLNYRMANAGTIDGLQLERTAKPFFYGFFAGSHPSFTDYGFDLNQFQFGGYIARVDSFGNNANMENTAAFFNQTVKLKTDRRFIYLQHSDSFLKDMDILVSSELDLFKIENSQSMNTLSLTSLYSSLRYTFTRDLNASISYDARKNVVYYESFKTYLDSLFSNELLKGLRWNISYRPFNTMSIGLNGGLQSQKSDPKLSQNYGSYMYISDLPIIQSDANISGTYLSGSYIKGITAGAELSKRVTDNLYPSIGYRFFYYKYQSIAESMTQHVVFSNISFTISRDIQISLYYEGTIDNSGSANRIYIDCSTRF